MVINTLYDLRKQARMAKNFILADMLEIVGEDVKARDQRVLGPLKGENPWR